MYESKIHYTHTHTQAMLSCDDVTSDPDRGVLRVKGPVHGVLNASMAAIGKPREVCCRVGLCVQHPVAL